MFSVHTTSEQSEIKELYVLKHNEQGKQTWLILPRTCPIHRLIGSLGGVLIPRRSTIFTVVAISKHSSSDVEDTVR